MTETRNDYWLIHLKRYFIFTIFVSATLILISASLLFLALFY